MAAYKNLDGTMKEVFSIGKGSNRIDVRTNAGVAQARNNGGSWIDIIQGLDDIVFPNDGQVSTFDTLQHALTHMWSSATVDGFGITDNGNGTVDIAAGEVVLRSSDSIHSDFNAYYLPTASGLVPTDNDQTFFYVDYNAGSPIINQTLDPSTIDGRTEVPIWLVTRIGTDIHLVDLREYSSDYAYKRTKQNFYIDGFQHVPGGTVVTETGTRNLNVTAGSFYIIGKEQTHPAFNTSVSDTFTYVYSDGGSGWTRVASQSQISNTQYDNAGTLTAIPNNKFGVNYLFVILNNPSELVVKYGTASYNTLSEAQAAPVPTTLPPEVSAYSTGVFVAKIIVQEGKAAFADIQSPFTTQLSSANAASHNTLADLMGGALNQYYHLAAAHYGYVTNQMIGAGYIVGGSGSGDTLLLKGNTVDGGIGNEGSVTLTQNTATLKGGYNDGSGTVYLTSALARLNSSSNGHNANLELDGTGLEFSFPSAGSITYDTIFTIGDGTLGFSIDAVSKFDIDATNGIHLRETVNVYNSSNGYPLFVCNANSNINLEGFFYDVKRSRGTFASPTDVAVGDLICSFESKSYYSAAHRKSANYYTSVASVSGSTAPGEHNFGISYNGTSYSNMFRISPSGIYINEPGLDYDFYMYKNGGANSFRYDSTYDTFYYESPMHTNSNISFGTQGYIQRGGNAYLQMNNLGPIFNPGYIDIDFAIGKSTSGEYAYYYDAGNETHQFRGFLDDYLFFIDAFNDFNGFGTNTPSEKVDVVGNIGVTGRVDDTYMSIEVSKASHGYSVLQALYNDGTNWQLAKSDDANTLGIAIVTEVPDANTFVYKTFGKAYLPAHGYTPGQYLFVSSTTSGELVDYAPFSLGTYSNPLAYVLDADTLFIFPWRPTQSITRSNDKQCKTISGVSSYDVKITDERLIVDCSTGDVTINLLAPSTIYDGFNVSIKKKDSSAFKVIVKVSSGNIDDVLGTVGKELTTQNETEEYTCDGTQYWAE